MTGIDRIGSAAPAGFAGEQALDARGVAAAAMVEIAARIEQWADRIAGAGRASAGAVPLPPGGDIYGLRTLAGDIARASGASAIEEGRLLSALESFASEAAVRLFGLAGSDAAVRAADIAQARDLALGGAMGGAPADDLIARLEDATRRLEATS